MERAKRRVFGRGRHHRRRGGRGVAELSEAAWQETELSADDGLPVVGPFDEVDAPDDGLPRLDLGSVRLPMPDGAQLQVEVDPAGPVRAVHVLTSHGQLTIGAFAAPRSGGLWKEIRAEIAAQLRADGATVDEVPGEWGREVHAVTIQAKLCFVGIDGPRWLLRGVAAAPAETHGELVELLYEVLRDTIVVRGVEPMPVRSPLPFTLPGPIAEQVKQTATVRAP